MSERDAERYRQLQALTARVARAAAELIAARDDLASLPRDQSDELEALADRLVALQVLLANEQERAWNAAEADARRARRAEMMGRVHDAVSAETTLPEQARQSLWTNLGAFGPEGPVSEDLLPKRLNQD